MGGRGGPQHGSVGEGAGAEPGAEPGAVGEIDRLMERASEALVATAYFEAAVDSRRALELAHRAGDVERMARICLPLQEARRQVREQALDAGAVGVFDSLEGVSSSSLASAPVGCWLLRPPLGGREAGRLRDSLWSAGVPALVLACEPAEGAGEAGGQWAVVAADDRLEVRAGVESPAGAVPSATWFAAAAEALGDAAIAGVDAGAPARMRIEALLQRLDLVPDHEKLHQRLEEACREALHEGQSARG